MKTTLITILSLALTHAILADDVLSLHSPLDWQVIQRRTLREGDIPVTGRCGVACDRIEVRLTGKTMTGSPYTIDWSRAKLDPVTKDFKTDLATPAGGWYVVEVRALRAGD